MPARSIYPAPTLAPLLVSVLLAAAGCAGPPPAPSTALVDAAGIAFVRIPAGEFAMGSDEPAADVAAAFPGTEPDRHDDLADEAPVHRVRITRPFLIGRYEVTVGQFRRFVEASGYVAESEADGSGAYGYNAARAQRGTTSGEAFEGRSPRYSWRDPGFPQTDDHPVVNVTWNDAVAMAAWLSRIEGVRYRLPTEAEWEYAARAGTRTRYHSGDDPRSLARVANVFDADAARHWPAWRARALDAHDGYAFTAPVGRFSPNAFGLHDMHGNAWEWVADWYDAGYYRVSPVDDPTGPAEGVTRVRRGGSWHTWPLYARSAFRNWNTPQTRYVLVGFRLVRELE